jgi:hypothetical protein
MKKLSEKRGVVGSDAWGRTTRTDWTVYEVELSDVNTRKENFRGMGHSVHQFTQADVGKQITVYSCPGWNCWMFGA